MTRTLRQLSRQFDDHMSHIYTPGRQADYQVPDKIVEGMTQVQTTKLIDPNEESGERSANVEAEDLADTNY
jgi:hypothetical protein